MSDSPDRKPYSRLPETFALTALLVFLDLVAMAWPVSNVQDFLLRTIGYSIMLTTAATHSWFFAQRALWSNASNAVATTFMWLVVLATGVFAIEWYAGSAALGWVAVAQIVLCSFLFNHATLRMTHFVAFLVMIVASTRLPLGIGGAAWVVFAILSMLVLAYDRTARKAGPSGYDRGEFRWPVQRFGVVSAVAIFSALLFLVTPLLKWPDFNLGRKPPPPSISRNGRPSMPSEDPFRIGGNTSTPDPDTNRLPILKVRLEPAISSSLYVRGQSFDTFDGASWTNDESERRTLDLFVGEWTPLPVEQPSIPPASAVRVRQSYEMLVDLEGVVFTAFRPASLRFADANVDNVFVDATGRTVQIDGVLAAESRYEVDGFQDVFAKGSLVLTKPVSRRKTSVRYEQVPTGIDPQVMRIAAEQTMGASTPYEKAVALERYLRRSFYYSLSHDVGGPQVVNDFMLRTKRGHCALFASSMVVMARSVGLPARYVTGFIAQEQTRDGFVVRGSDAHAWVEVYVEGAGWLSFDPTSGTIEPGDSRTQALTDDNGREDVRVADPRDRTRGGAGGLYGRGDRDRDGGDPRQGDIARNDDRSGAGGAGDDPSSDNAGGTSDGGSVGGDSGGDSSGGDSSGSDGTVNGGDIGRNDDRQSGSAGTGDGSGAGSTPTVIPPGGGTSLPPGSNGGAGGGNQDNGGASGSPSGTAGGSTGGSGSGASEGSRGTADAPSSGSSRKVEAKPAPPEAPADPKAVERDWSLLVWLLAGLGIIGLALLGIWTFGVKKVAEKRAIREALPLTVDDDPDPRRLIVKLYHAMVGGLGRVGFVRKEGTTPAEYAASVAHREPGLAAPVGELTELFHDARYDDVPVTRAQAEKARSVWRRIVTSVKKVETTTD